MARTRDGLKILDQITGPDANLCRLIDKEFEQAEVARMIYQARTRAGLTQQELARRAGTRQPVIARLEDADYSGHSVRMLRRIAQALDLELHVELRPKHEATAAS
jgi:ribosome-binding protein aMBF1 (putative translation factor)